MVAVYGHTEGEVEERKRFWNDLDRIRYRVGRIYGEIGMRLQKRDVWGFKKKKRGRLKGVYTGARRG